MAKQKKPGKPNGKLLWDRLNEREKEILTNYMKKESNKELENSIKQTWENTEKYLMQTMRSNRISEERMDRIINQTNDKVDRVNGVKIMEEGILDRYIVLSKEEFQDLLEYAAVNCENCAGAEGCKLYDIQHRQNAPALDGTLKCKYAYVVNRRRVV